MSHRNDPDHPDYRDHNQGDERPTAEDREIARLERQLSGVTSQRDVLYAALTPFAEGGRDLSDSFCHRGLTTPEACSRCAPVLAARDALAKVLK